MFGSKFYTGKQVKWCLKNNESLAKGIIHLANVNFYVLVLAERMNSDKKSTTQEATKYLSKHKTYAHNWQ
jgi:hypothetical protein